MIHAVILAGGWGRRFWPKSRRRLPKQFLRLFRRCSPIQNLFNIIKSEIPKERIWVVTNKTHLKRLREQLPSLAKKNFLVEPESRNTAAAIGLASLTIKRIDPQAVTLVLSSDHMIGQKRSFLHTAKLACMLAKKEDVLVTIGIRPNRAAKEYGYLKIVQNSKFKIQSKKIYKVEKFIEKPDIKMAKAYLQSKRYLWNSGIFAWKVTTILKSIKKYLPQIYSGLQKIERNRNKPQYKNCLNREYSRFKNISIDYAVLEKAGNIYTVAGDFPWKDLGSWNNLTLVRDRQGNIIQGLHRGIDTSDSIICAENKHLIGTIGVRDLIIVHTPSATLICKRDKAQDVKKLTGILEKDKSLKKYL